MFFNRVFVTGQLGTHIYIYIVMYLLTFVQERSVPCFIRSIYRTLHVVSNAPLDYLKNRFTFYLICPEAADEVKGLKC